MNKTKDIHDLVVIGAGPAALTAAIYTTREEIDTTLYEKGLVGGLAATTDWINNYPGYMKGIEGLRLADELRGQAERFGTKIEFGEVKSLKRDGEAIILTVDDSEVRSRTALIATGSNYRKLGVPGEEEYYARGVHYCATCDGAFFKNRTVAVVGGGDVALEDAVFLARACKKVYLIHRRDTFRAAGVLQEAVKKLSNVEILYN